MSDVGRYRRAYPRLLRHPDFRKLTPTERLLVIDLLFGPQTNRIGLFHYSVHTAVDDIGSPSKRYEKLWLRLP